MTSFVRVIRSAVAPNISTEGWQSQARCAGQWWLFDLDHTSGEAADVDNIIEALNLCARCPVIDQCEQLRVDNNEHLQRNLVMAGQAWVAGKPWNPRTPPPKRRACTACGTEVDPKLRAGLCGRCYWQQRRANCGIPSDERMSMWLELQAQGYTRRAAAERMGIHKDALSKAISRATKQQESA